MAKKATNTTKPPTVLPDDLQGAIKQAIGGGRWMIAVWHIQDGEIKLHRTATDFPPHDIDQAVSLLSENVTPLRPGRS